MEEILKDKVKISTKTFPNYKENPSKAKGFVKINKESPGKEIQITSQETGEMMIARPYESIKRSFWKDELPYVKIYRESLIKVGSLSTPGLKLFTYVAYNLDINKDEIKINIYNFLDMFNYATDKQNKGQINRSNYYKALFELLTKEILYKKVNEDSTFFIDINVFFNGKRDNVYSAERERDFKGNIPKE